MITIKVSYECANCGAENIKQYACSNDNAFDLRYGAFNIVMKHRINLTAENECDKCGHLQEFELFLKAVKKENQ